VVVVGGRYASWNETVSPAKPVSGIASFTGLGGTSGKTVCRESDTMKV